MSRSLVRAERTGPIRSGMLVWNTATKRVTPSTFSSKTRSASARFHCGCPPGALSILTASAARDVTSGGSARPVRAATPTHSGPGSKRAKPVGLRQRGRAHRPGRLGGGRARRWRLGGRGGRRHPFGRRRNDRRRRRARRDGRRTRRRRLDDDSRHDRGLRRRVGRVRPAGRQHEQRQPRVPCARTSHHNVVARCWRTRASTTANAGASTRFRISIVRRTSCRSRARITISPALSRPGLRTLVGRDGRPACHVPRSVPTSGAGRAAPARWRTATPRCWRSRC